MTGTAAAPGLLLVAAIGGVVLGTTPEKDEA